jgi:hypothetical protein
MLTIEQILNFTKMSRPEVIKRARTIAVKFFKVEVERDWETRPYYRIRARCVGDTIPRSVELHAYGKTKNAKVWMTCDCEDFMYRAEVALNRRGNTEIIYSNGAMPRVTNPNAVPYTCKHILACILSGALSLARGDLYLPKKK